MDLKKLRDAQDVLEERLRADQNLERLFTRIVTIASELGRSLDDCHRDPQSSHDAVAAARGSLLEFLRSEGVTVFDALGEVIDLERHSIVYVQPPARSERVVLQVHREGLQWQSKIIQKAEVTASEFENPVEGEEE